MNTDEELHQNSRAAIREILRTMFSETTDTRIVARAVGAGVLGSRATTATTTTPTGVTALVTVGKFATIVTGNTAFIVNLTTAVTANAVLNAPIATIAGKTDSTDAIAAIINNAVETEANLAIDINSNVVNIYTTYIKALVDAAPTAATANAAGTAAKFATGSAANLAVSSAALAIADSAIVATGGTTTLNNVITEYGTSQQKYGGAATAAAAAFANATATATIIASVPATNTAAAAFASVYAIVAAYLAANTATAAFTAAAYATAAAAFATAATGVAVANATATGVVAAAALAYIAAAAVAALTATAVSTALIAALSAAVVVTAAKAIRDNSSKDDTKINAAHAIAKIAIDAASTKLDAPNALTAVAAIIAAAKKKNINSGTLVTWIVCGSPERIVTSTDFTGDFKTYMSTKSLGFRIQTSSGPVKLTITLGTKSGEIWTWSATSIDVTSASTGTGAGAASSWISAATTTSVGIPMMLVGLTFKIVNSILESVTAAPVSTKDTWTTSPKTDEKSSQAASFSKSAAFDSPTAITSSFVLRDAAAAGGFVRFYPGSYSRTTTKSAMATVNSSFENALDEAPYTHLTGTLKFGSSDKPYVTYSTTIAMNAVVGTTKDTAQKTKVDASSNGTFAMTASFVGSTSGTMTISGTNEYTGVYSFTRLFRTKTVGVAYSAAETTIDMSTVTNMDTAFVARLKGRTARLLVAPSGMYMRAFMAPTVGPSVEPTGVDGTVSMADTDSGTITLYSNQQAMLAVDFSEKWLSCTLAVNFASVTPLSFAFERTFGIFEIPCMADIRYPFKTNADTVAEMDSSPFAPAVTSTDFTATIQHSSGTKVRVNLDFSGGKYALFGTMTGEFEFATLLTPGNYGGMLHLLLLLSVQVNNGVVSVGLARKGEVASSNVRGSGDGSFSELATLQSGTKVGVAYNTTNSLVTVTGDGPGHVATCQIANHRISLKNLLTATILYCPSTKVGDFCIDYISHSVTGIVTINLTSGTITLSTGEDDLKTFLITGNCSLRLNINADQSITRSSGSATTKMVNVFLKENDTTHTAEEVTQVITEGKTLLWSGTAVGSKFTNTPLMGNSATVTVTINMMTKASYTYDRVSRSTTLVSSEMKYVSMNLVQTAVVFSGSYGLLLNGETRVVYLGDLDNAGDNFPATFDPYSPSFGMPIDRSDARPVTVTLTFDGRMYDAYAIKVGNTIIGSGSMRRTTNIEGQDVTIFMILSMPAAEPLELRIV